MSAVRLLLAFAFTGLFAQPTFGQEIGDWMVTRRRTSLQYGAVNCDVLEPGRLIQIYGIGDRSVEASADHVGWVPLRDLMSPSEAIAFFSEEIENRSHPFSGAAAYVARGNSYLAIGFFYEAVADYTVALRIQPRNTEALVCRAIARERQGDVGRALCDFDAAFKSKPELIGIAESSGYQLPSLYGPVIWACFDGREYAVNAVGPSIWTGGIPDNRRFNTTAFVLESDRPWFERPSLHPFVTCSSIQKANVRKRQPGGS